jgi:hypothetical protein
MYVNSGAKRGMLQGYLLHDFYNAVIKNERELYIASGSATNPQNKNF